MRTFLIKMIHFSVWQLRDYFGSEGNSDVCRLACASRTHFAAIKPEIAREQKQYQPNESYSEIDFSKFIRKWDIYSLTLFYLRQCHRQNKTKANETYLAACALLQKRKTNLIISNKMKSYLFIDRNLISCVAEVRAWSRFRISLSERIIIICHKIYRRFYALNSNACYRRSRLRVVSIRVIWHVPKTEHIKHHS